LKAKPAPALLPKFPAVDIGNLVDTGTMGQVVYVDKDFDLAVTGTSAYVDPHGLILENFGTGNSGNFVSYSNPTVDDLIVQGQTETDTEARAGIYRQIQEILLQDLPWVNFFVANPEWKRNIRTFFLLAVFAMGLVGAATAMVKILFIQSVPALLALILVRLAYRKA
jgi:ABC-type transport system substrate-binding protein